MTLNKKHMDMSLALAGAEDAARRETELQARLQSEMKQREKQRKEEHLRKLAATARAGGPAGPRSLASRLEEEEDGAAGAQLSREEEKKDSRDCTPTACLAGIVQFSASWYFLFSLSG